MVTYQKNRHGPLKPLKATQAHCPALKENVEPLSKHIPQRDACRNLEGL